MRSLRTLSIALLVLAVMVSSVTMAVARNQPRPMGEMVLCTGYGMVVVSVDAQGQPTGPMMPCPDCVIALAGLGSGGVVLPRPPQTLVALAHAMRNLPAPATGAPVVFHPRGPPVTV
ncbi:MAG: hypothetical protein JJU15_08060 [Pararhodobacter sp.]|nr:hypothetical protein [Pararhodobacter sp.]